MTAATLIASSVFLLLCGLAAALTTGDPQHMEDDQ